MDQEGRKANLHLVIAEMAEILAALRGEGKQVFSHCAEGGSRTASVAAMCGATHCAVPLDQAWTEERETLPGFAPSASCGIRWSAWRGARAPPQASDRIAP